MQVNRIFFFVILHCGVLARAQDFNYTEVQLEGFCPKISYINNLDLPQIVGYWYRAYSTADFPALCYENDGQNMYAASFDERTLSIVICCRSAANKSIAYCGSKIGSGTVTVTNKPGEFIYDFADQSVTIYVLDVVYDRFAIIYGCSAISGEDTIFILSRDFHISETETERVEDVLEQNGIDFSNAKTIDQGPHIPYLPSSFCSRSPMLDEIDDILQSTEIVPKNK